MKKKENLEIKIKMVSDHYIDQTDLVNFVIFNKFFRYLKQEDENISINLKLYDYLLDRMKLPCPNFKTSLLNKLFIYSVLKY